MLRIWTNCMEAHVEPFLFQKSMERTLQSYDAIAARTRIKWVRASRSETRTSFELAQTVASAGGQTIALPRETSVRIYTVVSITLIK